MLSLQQQPLLLLLPLLFLITTLLTLLPPTHQNSQVFPSTRKSLILGCSMQNFCSGHGTCLASLGQCVCSEGYGSPTEVEWLGYALSTDCSVRTCKFGTSWSGLPDNNVTASDALTTNIARSMKECSDNGICDRASSECKCFVNFRGVNCGYRDCPSAGCSGHGQCISMQVMAKMRNALPLSSPTLGSGNDNYHDAGETGNVWDDDRNFGCVCDSSWPVGLGAGETQGAEWFGPSCNSRRCPSNDNPYTTINELDCDGVTAEGGKGVGEPGNLCLNECSGRGVCNSNSGTCACASGNVGVDCSGIDARFVKR